MRVPARSATLAAAVLLAAPAFSGCGSAAGPASGPCGGASCAGVASYRLAAELDPPPGSTALAQAEVAAVQIGADGTTAVAFPPMVVFAGRVSSGDDPSHSIAAAVLLTRSSQIPGAAAVSYSTTALAGLASGGIAFSLVVPAADSYAVTIVPQDPTLAAKTPPTTFVEPMTGSHYRAVTVGGSATTLAVRGTAFSPSGGPVANLKATLLAIPASGSLDGEAVSSSGVTDAGGGFTAYVPISVLGSDVWVELQPPDSSAGTPAVYYRRHLAAPCGSPGGPIDLGQLALPSVPQAQTYSFLVEGLGPAGNMISPTGARVTFATEVQSSGASDWVAWRYRGEGVVGLDGTVAVSLIPGTVGSDYLYLITTVTPADSPLASAFDQTLRLGPASEYSQTIELSPRVFLVGSVSDATGTPAQNFVVTAFPGTPPFQTATAAEIAAIEGAPPQALTGCYGEFALAVDPTFGGGEGLYDLELQPPQGSPLPAWSSDNVVVDASAVAAGLLDVGAIALPAGAAIQGTVVDASGAAVPFAGVRLFAIDQAPGCTGADCTLTPRLRAAARADGQGAFTVTLANPPAP